MPTTTEEASRIITIAREYLPPQEVKELFTRLDREVGEKTQNTSLKESLFMMRKHIEMQKDEEKATNQPWLWPLFLLLVGVHLAVVFGLVLSFLLLPFRAPWYIALPIMSFLVFFCTTRVECQLTNLENDLRRKLGLKRIGGFVGHYLVKPVRRWIRH